MTSFLRRPAWCLLLLVLTAASGCGEKGPVTYPVKGTVRYEGKPLPFGAITFIAASGENTAASIRDDGTYEANLVPGTHRVAVIAIPPRQGRPDPNAEGGLDTTGFPEPKPIVPAKFGNYETSGVEVEVKEADENKLDIELK